jgi:hypothetical protein
MATAVSLVSFLNAGLPVVCDGTLTAGALDSAFAVFDEARMVKLSSELNSILISNLLSAYTVFEDGTVSRNVGI